MQIEEPTRWRFTPDSMTAKELEHWALIWTLLVSAIKTVRIEAKANFYTTDDGLIDHVCDTFSTSINRKYRREFNALLEKSNVRRD